jgi:hypothetical protein
MRRRRLGVLVTALGVLALWGAAHLAAGSAAWTALGAAAFATALFERSRGRAAVRSDATGWVWAGAVAWVAGAVFLLAGELSLALFEFAWGLAIALTGTQTAIATQPRPGTIAEPRDPDGSTEIRAEPLRLGVHASLAADELARGARVLRRPRPSRSGGAGAALDALEALRDERPAEFPHTLAKPELIERRGFAELTFEGAWVPSCEALRGVPEGTTRQRSLSAGLWRAGDRPGPALLVLSSPRWQPAALARRLARPARWRSLGLDVAVLSLATPRSDGLTGFGEDPLLASAWLERSAFEARRLVAWLIAEGAPSVGVCGFGWGASAASLLAASAPELKSAVLVAPLPAPQRVALDAMSAARLRAWAGGRWTGGREREALLERLRPWAPLARDSALAEAAGLLITASVDELAPPDEMAALRARWPGIVTATVSGGRSRALLLADGAASRVENHLRRTLLHAPAPTDIPLTRFRRP